MAASEHTLENPKIDYKEEAPEGHCFYVVGPNTWGKGETIFKARAHARVNLSFRNRRYADWMIRMVPDEEDTMLDDFGNLSFNIHDCGHFHCHAYKVWLVRRI